MASMLKDVAASERGEVNMDALKAQIRAALVSKKANVCPITMRLQWHASGTFDKADGSGGSDGARMRFEPERGDGANAGLLVIRDILLPIAEAYPEISTADLWAVASSVAIETLGGPAIPVGLGRKDEADGSKGCPGRLPDASLGADHLREVFGRMGFNDQEIVALSGGHCLGRCHLSRSGFDGPWTTKPLQFDNEYFVNLIEEEWVKREWDGPEQFEDKKTGKLMMLPTDLALIKDDKFRPHVERYAKDQSVFFEEFAAAYGKLIALGCPASCSVDATTSTKKEDADPISAEFREHAMHGSVGAAEKCLQAGASLTSTEGSSGRTALHKSSYWGHNDMTKFITGHADGAKILNAQDYAGETALMDAARFNHAGVVAILLAAGADTALKNKEGKTAKDIATAHGYTLEGL